MAKFTSVEMEARRDAMIIICKAQGLVYNEILASQPQWDSPKKSTIEQIENQGFLRLEKTVAADGLSNARNYIYESTVN